MEYTIDQWRREAEARFGPCVEDYKFICPRCGRVNVGWEFKEAGAEADDTAQCCIGRFTADKGCDWAAFGLFGTMGRGDVVIFPNGKRAEVFRMAEKDMQAGDIYLWPKNK